MPGRSVYACMLNDAGKFIDDCVIYRTDASGGTVKSIPEDMESKPNRPPSGSLRPILTVTNQADFAETLRLRRLQLGMTLADLDHLAGFHDGYAAHLERPFTRSGKKSFNLTTMAGVWLQALDLRLGLACVSSALAEDAERPTIIDTGAHQRPGPASRRSIT